MLNDFKISTRLAIMLVFFLFAFLTIGVAGLYSSGKLNRAMRSMYDDRMMPTLYLYGIHTANLNNALAISKAISEPEDMSQYIREIEKNKSFIDDAWNKYMMVLERDVKDKEEDAFLAAKFVEARRHFFDEGIKPAVAAMRANNLAEVERIQKEIVFPLTPPLDEALSLLINMETNEAVLAHEEGESLFSKIRLIFITTTLLSLMLGGLLGSSIIRGVNRAVSELRSVMARMSEDGNLSARARVYGKDEMSLVTGQFNVLLDSINSLAELKPVFDNLEEGLVFIDQQRRVIAINKAACRLMGQDSDAVLNKPCPDVFFGVDCAKDCKTNDQCTRMLEAKQEGKFVEISVRRPDKVLVNLRVLAIDLSSKGSMILRGTDW